MLNTLTIFLGAWINLSGRYAIYVFSAYAFVFAYLLLQWFILRRAWQRYLDQPAEKKSKQ